MPLTVIVRVVVFDVLPELLGPPKDCARTVIVLPDTLTTLPATTFPKPLSGRLPPGAAPDIPLGTLPVGIVPVGRPDGRLPLPLPLPLFGTPPPNREVVHDDSICTLVALSGALELVDELFDALVAITQAPTRTALGFADRCSVNVVFLVYFTAVWSELLCTCNVVPLFAAISPLAAAPPTAP